MMKSTLRIVPCLLICLLSAVAAAAQTPGEAAKRPDVLCGRESGEAARACHQYCRTMACASSGEVARDERLRSAAAAAEARRPSAATRPEATAEACGEVRAQFRSLTGREVPCDQLAACPCFDPLQWDDARAGLTWRNFAGGSFNRDYASCTADPSQVILELDLPDAHPKSASVEVALGECRVFDGNAREPDHSLNVSASGARACSRALRRAGDKLCK